MATKSHTYDAQKHKGYDLVAKQAVYLRGIDPSLAQISFQSPKFLVYYLHQIVYEKWSGNNNNRWFYLNIDLSSEIV